MPSQFDKLERVRHQGLEAIRIALAHGVPVAFGTDLLGRMQVRQSEEFALRLAAQAPADILRSATWTAAQLLRCEGGIGVLAPGALAEGFIVDDDPTRSVEMWTQPTRSIRLVMQGGRLVADRLGQGRPGAPVPS